MTTLLFIRHGYSEGNKNQRFSGQMDFPLDEAGRLQALDVADYLCNTYHVDAIYSSDLSRAYNTVKPLSDALSLPIHAEKALREIDVGLWEGVLRSEVEKLYPENYEFYQKNPGLVRFDGGESFLEMRERALNAVQKIVAENKGKTVVIATHGGVIRVLRTVWENIPIERMVEIPHVPNASVTVVKYEGEFATMHKAGYCDYLTERITEKL